MHDAPYGCSIVYASLCCAGRPSHGHMASIENLTHTRRDFSVFIPSTYVNRLAGATLWTLLVLMYLLSGVLTFASNYVYRMGLMSFLVLPLLLVRGVRFDRATLGFALLVGVILLSGVVNASSVDQIVTFLRIPLFAYLVYYMTSVALNERNLRRVMTFLLIVAVVQLPVMLLQWWAFDKVPDSLKVNVGVIDYGFGTFNFKTDYSMSFLLTMIVAWLLLDGRRSQWVRYRIPLAIYYSLTVVAAAAQIMKVGVILVWLLYLVTHLRLRTMLLAVVGAMVLYFGAGALYNAGLLSEDPAQFIQRIQLEQRQSDTERYLSGNYDRWGGLQFLLSGNVPLLGDGPSAYTDAVTRITTRGNTGHFFVFFSEIGPIGWAASVLVYALIAFPFRRGRLRIGLLPTVFFFLINLLSFTSAVMNDIAVVTSFCIMIMLVSAPPVANSPVPVGDRLE